VAFIFSPRIHEELRPIVVATYFVLASAMACRVFRTILLGITQDPQLNTARLVSFYRSGNQLIPTISMPPITSRHEKPDSSSKLEINVAVETATTAGFNEGYPLWERNLMGDNMRDVSRNV
jgi:hypothetical protein